MLFPIFVVMTLLEIYVLVTVGKAIGGFSTVLLVIVTALIGSYQEYDFEVLQLHPL